MPSDAGQTAPIVDDRGYADLMAYLFPGIDRAGADPIPWSCLEYPTHAMRAWGKSGSRSPWQRAVRAEVWEPVVRHVALALAALETTSRDPNEAYAHLRVEAEIRGEWIGTLGVLLGESTLSRPAQLPREPLP